MLMRTLEQPTCCRLCLFYRRGEKGEGEGGGTGGIGWTNAHTHPRTPRVSQASVWVELKHWFPPRPADWCSWDFVQPTQTKGRKCMRTHARICAIVTLQRLCVLYGEGKTTSGLFPSPMLRCLTHTPSGAKSAQSHNFFTPSVSVISNSSSRLVLILLRFAVSVRIANLFLAFGSVRFLRERREMREERSHTWSELLH